MHQFEEQIESSLFGGISRDHRLDRPRFSRLPDENGSLKGSHGYSSLSTAGSLDDIVPPKSTKQIPEALHRRITKTRLCTHYARGRCIRAEHCSFAHSADELRAPPDLQKTRLCLAWMTTNSCFKGADCKYAHGLEELKSTPEYYKTALCPLLNTAGGCTLGGHCRYAHSAFELRSQTESNLKGGDLCVAGGRILGLTSRLNKITSQSGSFESPSAKVNLDEVANWRTGSTSTDWDSKKSLPTTTTLTSGLLMSPSSPLSGMLTPAKTQPLSVSRSVAFDPNVDQAQMEFGRAANTSSSTPSFPSSTPTGYDSSDNLGYDPYVNESLYSSCNGRHPPPPPPPSSRGHLRHQSAGGVISRCGKDSIDKGQIHIPHMIQQDSLGIDNLAFDSPSQQLDSLDFLRRALSVGDLTTYSQTELYGSQSAVFDDQETQGTSDPIQPPGLEFGRLLSLWTDLTFPSSSGSFEALPTNDNRRVERHATVPTREPIYDSANDHNLEAIIAELMKVNEESN